MHDLELWLPGRHVDLGSPIGADQDQALFAPRDAFAAGETQHPGAGHHYTRLLPHLPAQGLLDRLALLGPAGRETLVHAVVADQYQLIGPSQADAGSPVRQTSRRIVRPMPRDQPILPARMRRQLFPVPSRTP